PGWAATRRDPHRICGTPMRPEPIEESSPPCSRLFGSFGANSGRGVNRVQALGEIAERRIAQLNGVIVGALSIQKFQKCRTGPPVRPLRDGADIGGSR